MAIPAAPRRSEPRSSESRFSSAPGVGAKRSRRVTGTESPRTGRIGSISSVPTAGRTSRPGAAIRRRNTDGEPPLRCCRARRFRSWPSRPVCTSPRCSSTSGHGSGRRPPLGTAGVVRRPTVSRRRAGSDVRSMVDRIGLDRLATSSELSHGDEHRHVTRDFVRFPELSVRVVTPDDGTSVESRLRYTGEYVLDDTGFLAK